MSFVLIEPMERRVSWLDEQIASLGLTNVEVVRARAEDTKLELPLDQATARAVSSLRKLLPVVAPLVRRSGELVLMKGANAEAEISAATKEIRKYRIHDVEVLTLGEGLLTETTRVVRGRVG